MNATVQNVGGNVSLTTAAIGNTFSLTSLPLSTLTLNNSQSNAAINVATANLNMTNVAGNIALTTAAIGNSFTVSPGN
jgi:hypothetical protein